MTRARSSRRRSPDGWTTRVRDRIIAETRGNPLALLELPRDLTAAELAGGFALPDAQPLAGRIEQSFVRRLSASGGDATPPARGRRRADRRREPVVARSRRARDHGRRSRAGRSRGSDRVRRPGALPSSARALRGVSGSDAAPTDARPIERWPMRPTRTPIPTAGRGTARMPRPALTRRWRTSSSAPPTGRSRRGGVAAAAAFLAAGGRVDARSRPPGTACARRSPGQVRRRRARRGVRAAHDRRARAPRRPSASASRTAPRADRLRAHTRRRCPAAAARRGQTPRAARRRAGP